MAAWRGGWNEGADPTLLRRWLAATARNLARMSVRSESNRRAREAHVAAERSGSSASVDARIAMQKHVAEVVAALPPEDREVVVLRYFDGLPPREIAERLKTTPGAVSSRLSRARGKLRAELGDQELGGGPAAAPETVEPEAAVPAADAPGKGSVLVRVVSGETDQPLPGVGISVRSASASGWYNSTSGPSDLRGERLFSSLPVGRVLVTAWRVGAGGENDPGGAVEVLANETAELTIQLGAGATITGRVVDEQGRSVAGAEIWMSAGNSGPGTSLLAGHANARGRFELPHTGPLQCVGAKAPGMKPSLQWMPNVVKPEDAEDGVTLVLRELGGELSGRVVTESGEPVPGADVKIESLEGSGPGEPLQLTKGFAYTPAAILLRTDQEGAFATDTLGSGSFRVLARGRDSSLARREVQIAPGGRAELEIVVGETGSLSGIITDHQGHPVPSANVVSYGDDWDLEWAEVIADEVGVYSIPALSPGSLDVEVLTDPGKPGVKGTILIIAGQDTEWSPSLPAPLAILGRAISSTGSPLEGFHVRGKAQVGDGPMATLQVSVKTDEVAGAKNLPDGDLWICGGLQGHHLIGHGYRVVRPRSRPLR